MCPAEQLEGVRFDRNAFTCDCRCISTSQHSHLQEHCFSWTCSDLSLSSFGSPMPCKACSLPIGIHGSMNVRPHLLPDRDGMSVSLGDGMDMHLGYDLSCSPARIKRFPCDGHDGAAGDAVLYFLLNYELQRATARWAAARSRRRPTKVKTADDWLGQRAAAARQPNNAPPSLEVRARGS